MKTAAFLIGFGGPEGPEQVRPFLESVLQGARIPKERFDAVLSHYEKIGNASPYNAIALRQREALREWLRDMGKDLPVYLGFRHSSPALKEVFLEMKKDGIEKAVGFVLSPLESPASFGKYTEKASQARREADALSIDVVYAGPFHNNAQFLAAQAGRAEEALHSLNGDAPQRTFILFSAHSIPVKMSEESGYASQFSAAAAAVARKLGYPSWGTAYQSRSGGPREPWLGPDVKEAVAAIDRKIFRNVAVVPIGFVSDNAEVLYDLDIELKGVVEGLGLRYIRASTAMDDPRFIAMMGQCVLRNLEEKG